MGLYHLSPEGNLGIMATGNFGYDSLGLGAQGTGGPVVNHQLVGTIATSSYWLGVLGLDSKSSNLSSFDSPVPSLMANLKQSGSIPSLSFGYTAGAPYRLKKVLGSLTLGGYDQSRFTPNDVIFTFADDNSRDLVVGIQSITWSSDSSPPAAGKASLLSTPVFAYVDSTVPHIWLPLDACRAFEEAFGLVYDNTTSLYLVNDTLHSTLVAQNPNVTFTLGNGLTGGATVSIVLPYASFDLTATSPLVANTSRYFPLQRAANDTQYTIGRTFLQETYLTVDWERAVFNISQALFQEDAASNIVTISPVNATTISGSNSTSDSAQNHSSHSLSTGAIAGIAVGFMLVAGALLAIVIYLFIRRRNKRRRLSTKASETDEANSSTTEPTPYGRPPNNTALSEMEGSEARRRLELGHKYETVASELNPAYSPGQKWAFWRRKLIPELPTPIPAEELAGSHPKMSPRIVHEMPGDEGTWPADRKRPITVDESEENDTAKEKRVKAYAATATEDVLCTSGSGDLDPTRRSQDDIEPEPASNAIPGPQDEGKQVPPPPSPSGHNLPKVKTFDEFRRSMRRIKRRSPPVIRLEPEVTQIAMKSTDPTVPEGWI